MGWPQCLSHGLLSIDRRACLDKKTPPCGYYHGRSIIQGVIFLASLGDEHGPVGEGRHHTLPKMPTARQEVSLPRRHPTNAEREAWAMTGRPRSTVQVAQAPTSVRKEGYFPFPSGLRFSVKAAMPSFLILAGKKK